MNSIDLKTRIDLLHLKLQNEESENRFKMRKNLSIDGETIVRVRTQKMELLSKELEAS